MSKERAELAAFARCKNCLLFVLHEVSLPPVNKDWQKWSALKIFKLIFWDCSKFSYSLSEHTFSFMAFFSLMVLSSFNSSDDVS